MYLIEIDGETGLILDSPTNSGWKAIKAFNAVFKKKGIKGMTVIALAADYLSPIAHYAVDKDRYARACEEIFGKRNAINFEEPLYAEAIEKYRELQLDPDLETEKINREIKLRLLNKINEANKNEDDASIEKFRKSLQDHENSVKNFNSRFNKKEAVAKAATANGYELSRIEADIKSRKNSKFVSHGDNIINPDQLGLT